MVFLEDLVKCQRTLIKESKTLGKISKNKISDIIEDTEIPEGRFDDVKDMCWIWKGLTLDDRKGHQHGRVWYKNNYRHVHRLMYHNFIEDVPEYDHKNIATIVTHTCSHNNNGRCINPWHLNLGTPKSNMQDAVIDGTKYKAPKGEKNWKSKLSDDQIKEIRSLKGNTTMTQREIAAKYGVNQSQISRWWNETTRTQG